MFAASLQGQNGQLYNAALLGDDSAIRRLVACGADANWRNPNNDGNTSLHVAARKGHVKAVRALLQAGADAAAKDKAGKTPMDMASSAAAKEALQAAVDQRKQKPLLLAFKLAKGSGPSNTAPAVARPPPAALVKASSPSTTTTSGGARPPPSVQASGTLALPTSGALFTLRAPLTRGQEKDQELFDAASRGDTAAIRRHVAGGANVNWCSPANDGNTPMHVAAHNGHVEAVRALLQAGADAAVRNKIDWTPLHKAACNGDVGVVRALLQAGVDAGAKTKMSHQTALHEAARKGNVEALRALLRVGVDVAVKTKLAWMTPLHLAAQNGHVEAVQALLQVGADVAAKTKAGNTPLDMASSAAVKEALHAAVNQQKQATSSNTTTPGVARPLSMAQAAAPKPSSTPSFVLKPLRSRPTSGTLAMYTGGVVTLPSPLAGGQERAVVTALLGAGLQAAAQVVGAVATCNPVALLMAPMKLLQVVRTMLQQGHYCHQRLRRIAARIAAVEPILNQLGQELQPPMRTSASVNMVQSLCATLMLLVHVLAQLQELQKKLLSKGEGRLQRALQMLKTSGYEQDVASLDNDLRGCLAQLSVILNIAQFTQAAQLLRAREELQVAQWQFQDKIDRILDRNQLEGLMVEAAGGVKALQKELAEQKVELQQVANWLQQMRAGNTVISRHLRQMGKKLDGLGQQMGHMQLDVAVVKDQVAQLVTLMMPPQTGQLRRKKVPMDSLPDLAISRERIQVANDLDSALADAKRGAFGGVVQGSWEGHQVAIKVYNYTGLGRTNCKDAVKEAVLLCKANHPNIVRCYGVVYDPETAARDSILGSLVMEWVGGGSLHEWLQDEAQHKLGLRGRVLLGQRVTRGMRHLNEKRLVHGDLKPQNILMCSLKPAAGDIVPQVKLCDFGLAKHTSTSMQSTQKPTTVAFTLPYTSPERLVSGEATPQDDAYALGILLYFIATGSDPFASVRPNLLPEAIKAGTRPKLDRWLARQATGRVERKVAQAYCDLARRCWDSEPGKRPKFEDVHADLSAMLDLLRA